MKPVQQNLIASNALAARPLSNSLPDTAAQLLKEEGAYNL
jgi:hypothetical protein